MKDVLIEETVEVICVKGCQSVRDDIARLEKNQQLPETIGLTCEQRVMVLRELQSIMSVYGDTCRADGKLRGKHSVLSEEEKSDSLLSSIPGKTVFSG